MMSQSMARCAAKCAFIKFLSDTQGEFVMKKLTILGLVLLLCLSATWVAMAAEGVHWSYSGEEGPAHWGELSPDYAACADGSRQSPINIPAGAPLNPADLTINYQPSGLTTLNNGHTIQANYDPGSSITLDGTTYDLIQFHFHNTSEHTLQGQYAPMEVHFVHKNADGQLAVIGVMLQPGAANAALEPIFANMPATAGDPQAIAGVTVNAADMLPAGRSYYRYDGSLTTPPCSEGVAWFVMASPIAVSDAQIAAYKALYTGNYRPIQALNQRSFYLGGAPQTLPTTGAFIGVSVAWVSVASGLLVLAFIWFVRRRQVVGQSQ
jgi:carbonic anhydrase